jgi:hypothetical protein
MKKGVSTVRYRWILGVISIVAVCCSASIGYAASYYPDELGNTWFFRSTDGIDERIITIRGPETINGEVVKIIAEQTNNNVNQLFIKTELDGVKLFRSVVSLDPLGDITFDYSPPQTFLPIPIELGSQWTVQSETEIPLAGRIRTTNRAEVVAIEDVTVPAGTFRKCLKIEQNIILSLTIADLELSNAMWLAPNIGIVKSIDTNEIVFELIRYNITVEGPGAAVQPKGKLAMTWAALKQKETLKRF